MFEYNSKSHISNNIISPEIVAYVNKIFCKSIARRNQYIYIQLHITDKCENSCYYCYVDKHQVREMTYECFVKVIENLRKYSLERGVPLFVNLIGGNPLLSAFIFDCLNYLNDNHIEFYLTCNPSPITRKIAKLLKSYSLLRGVQFTVVGDEKLHKSIRGVRDFNSLIFNTMYLIRLGIAVTWRLNIAKHFLGRVEAIFEMICCAKPTIVAMNRLCKIGNASDILENMTADECRCILDSFFKNFCKTFREGVRFGFKEHLWFPYLVEEGVIDYDYFKNLHNSECRCRAFYEHYVIDVDGAVLLCRKLPQLSLGNCFNEDMREIVLNNNRRLFVDLQSYVKCSRCKYNRWCMGCPAVSRSFGNSVFESDPHCWVEVSDAH